MMISIAIIWIICISICNGDDPSKLKGGTRVEISSYPFVASLQWKGVHHCGGSIISHDTIITSASCVVIDTVPLIYQSNLEVLIGTDNNLVGDGVGACHIVKLIIAHQNYDPHDSWNNDLAVLKLETPIAPYSGELLYMKLPTQIIGQTLQMSTVGWGGTNQLHKLFMKSKRIRDCVEMFVDIQFLKNSKGCATSPKPKAHVVFGDSGNPLIQFNAIAGVISVFDPRNPENILFTKIYGYRHWIEAVTRVY